jgi:hypothetical protein
MKGTEYEAEVVIGGPLLIGHKDGEVFLAHASNTEIIVFTPSQVRACARALLRSAAAAQIERNERNI